MSADHELPIFILDNEQPTTCPMCGARTEFDETADGTQNHCCRWCQFQFVGEFDDEMEETLNDMLEFDPVSPLDWTRGALAKGLRCYQNSEFFLAHEYWENIWLLLEEPEKSFLEALIESAAAFHNLRCGNLEGAVPLLKSSLRRLELCSPSSCGIATGPHCGEIRKWVQALASGAGPLPTRFPTIVLANQEI
jgi:hypothetical protein